MTIGIPVARNGATYVCSYTIWQHQIDPATCHEVRVRGKARYWVRHWKRRHRALVDEVGMKIAGITYGSSAGPGPAPPMVEFAVRGPNDGPIIYGAAERNGWRECPQAEWWADEEGE